MRKHFGKKLIVPFSDVSILHPDRYLKKIAYLLKTGDFILGKDVENFEKDFSSYIGVKFCIGVGSGTDALLLALKALNISTGDEVIVPAFSFIASASPILMIGAKPVFIDIKENLPIIDEKQIEEKISKKTRAIIVVHLYGFPCNLEIIKKIAKKYNIALIEDVAQAHGAIYRNKKVGSFGDISIFSFYPTKNLGAFGDAGAITTNNKTYYKKIMLLRDHGQSKKYKHEILGYNSRLDTLQAIILRLKLKELNKNINKKRQVAQEYTKHLSQLPLKIFTPNKNNDYYPAPYLYVVRSKKRNQLMGFLSKKGIPSMIHFPYALPDEKIFNYKANKKDFLNARQYASSVLSLPFFATMTDEQINLVVEFMSEFFVQHNN